MGKRLVIVLSSFVIGISFWVSLSVTVQGRTQISTGAIQEVDQGTLKELLATFEQAEQAMQSQDLDGIMALYSDDYQYHGLKKADIRKVWNRLFEHYKELESHHTFSVIRTVGSGSKLTAEITCTGVVWGTSKDTTLRTPVDSWYEEVHYLKREQGRWRIVGHAGGESQPILQFGIAPHPLF